MRGGARDCSFCSDAEVAEQFADDKLVKFLLGVLETSSSTAQAQQARDDSIAILAGVARTTKGKRVRGQSPVAS